MTQSRGVGARLTALGASVELETVRTAGDASSAAIDQIGGTGVFVTALREALLERRVDLAVHSYKDLPTAPFPGLTIAAIPVREDPRDALVARDGLTLGELPTGARIGTGSPRRTAPLRGLGLGIDVVPIRGNVDTRIARVTAGELDGVVLARAGLARLSRLEQATEVIDPLTMLPAPAQGALALECREDDDELRTLLAQLDDLDSRACVAAERALLAALEGGCTAPVGALAAVAEGEDGMEIYLRGTVAALDGSDAVRSSATGSTQDAAAVGRRLADEMLEVGAASLLGARS